MRTQVMTAPSGCAAHRGRGPARRAAPPSRARGAVRPASACTGCRVRMMRYSGVAHPAPGACTAQAAPHSRFEAVRGRTGPARALLRHRHLPRRRGEPRLAGACFAVGTCMPVASCRAPPERQASSTRGAFAACANESPHAHRAPTNRGPCHSCRDCFWVLYVQCCFMSVDCTIEAAGAGGCCAPRAPAA